MTKKTYNSLKKKPSEVIPKNKVIPKKPISFKPTDEVKKFLNDISLAGGNKSKTINESIILYKKLKTEPKRLLDRFCLKYPFIWRSINRRNGQFITQKIRSKK